MRLLAITLLFVAFRPVGRAQTDWPAYGHDPGGLQYSPLKQIDTKNAAKLQIAWTYDTRPAATPASEGVPAKAAPRNRASQATPLVVGGVMYLSTPYGRVVALEPETGKKVWEYESEYMPSGRGIAYWPGDEALPPQIVVGTMNGWLFTLNARTGKLTTSFGDNGKVNLRTGVTENFPRGRYAMSSPAAIYKNLIFTGAQLQKSPPVDRVGTFAPGTSIPENWSGRFTPFRVPASATTTPGRKISGRIAPAPTCGVS